MKNILFYVFILQLAFLNACKKSEIITETPKEQIIKESLSYKLDGEKFVFESPSAIKSEAGFSNHQINIKPYDNEIVGRRASYTTGNKFWYGEKDSTMFAIRQTWSNYESSNINQLQKFDFKIAFTKKYANRELIIYPSLLLGPSNANISELYNLGSKKFAFDFEKENTSDGVAISLYSSKFRFLYSYFPGFSVLVRPTLPKTIQNNSKFEIKKIDKIDNEFSLLECEFELNVFDEEGKAFRITEGKAKILVPNTTKMFGLGL